MSDRDIEDAPAFLASDPPPWVARGLSTLLLALFAVAATGAVVVRMPETVSGAFVLMPVHGIDPLRASREGTVDEVRVVDGQAVARGEVLFVIRSSPVSDRVADFGSARTQAAALDAALATARAVYDAGRRSDEADVARIATHLDYLNRLVPIRRQQARLAEEEAARRREGVAQRVVSVADLNAAEQDAQRLAGDATAIESEQAETRASLQKLRADMDTRRAEFAQTTAQIEAQRNEAHIRAGALSTDSTDWARGMLAVRAPCAGTTLRVLIGASGAVVQAGEALAEVACADAPLQAELRLPEQGVALVRPGQGVKLMYDAFPYQRFGVRHGVVRWVGPAALARDSTTLGFRALVDVDTGAVRVDGTARGLSAGMAGTADVVVGRRPLAAYVLEPLRQLRESFADAPSRGGVNK